MIMREPSQACLTCTEYQFLNCPINFGTPIIKITKYYSTTATCPICDHATETYDHVLQCEGDTTAMAGGKARATFLSSMMKISPKSLYTLFKDTMENLQYDQKSMVIK